MYHRAKVVKALSSRSQTRQPKPSKAPAKAARPSKAVKPAVQPAARSASPKAAAKAAAPLKAVAKSMPTKNGVAPKAATKSTPTKNGTAAKPSAPAPAPKAASKPAATKLEPTPSSLPPPSAKKRKSIKEAAGVSTDAVMRRTGKSWDDWFEVLDTAGAQTLDQRGVIAILAQKHGIGPWWQQMIAVGYESLRGKSDKPPTPDGFHINSSCSLNAPVTRVFKLWNDAGERARWLADDRFVVRGATADKVIRARWGKGTSHVAVSFSEKSGRTEVSVEHHQIETSAAAEQMKAYWAKKLGLLDQALAPKR
ncbi:MAG TPA: hypothetical protein VHB79_31900 [Polyangiaceae bacterium]|nr:hypothetical protein [Polyangiaceae bacterium]